MAKDVDLSSDEWRDLVFEGKNKDFGAYELRKNSPKRHNWAMVAVVVFILAVFAASLLVSQITKEEEKPKESKNQELATLVEEAPEEEIEEIEQIEMPPEEVAKPEEVLNTDKATEIAVVPDDQVTEPPKSAEELQQSTTAVGVDDVSGGVDDVINAEIHTKNVVIEETPPPPPPADDNKVFETVEQNPQFPGGESALLQYIASHIKYPTVAQENGIQGRVVVRFVVTKSGSVGNVQVVRGKDPDLDKEAVRVVKSLPKFTPGKMNGHPVNVWYTVPITFKLMQ